MIVYQKSKEDFSNDVLSNDIDGIIARAIQNTTGKAVADSEMRSFRQSLLYMDKILNDKDIPEDCGISIEYHIPFTSKRIDFLITGSDGERDNLIIVELKAWSEAWLTDRDGMVDTRLQGRITRTIHPSYQAWSYGALLQSFNATIEEESITVQPCAYLHNYDPDEVLNSEFYSYYTDKAPIFLKPDAVRLRSFIKHFMKYGDQKNLIVRIEKGKIRPSKSLADSLKSIMKGNKEFIMIDDQKSVYEEALWLAAHSNEKTKNVLIVEGGPGTGKSVVAINLLVELNRRGLMAQYVTKTSAPREVYFDKLKGERRMPELKNLFVSSGSFMKAPKNAVATLIVDEAHRLTERTGFLKMGDNQVKEIINTSLFSVFFIDEDQRVHIDDYANTQIIEDWAKKLGAKVTKLSLSSQFRCSGSDGYLAWLDNLLQIRDTANTNLHSSDINYDFRVVDSPSKLRDLILEKNKTSNKARLVAGYCWDWASSKDANAFDINIPDFNFQARWNLKTYGSTWIIDPNSVNEIGCIHTCQGLEVDFVGVIIGPDLIYRDGQVLVDPTKRSKDDKSILGYKKLLQMNESYGKQLLRTIIKNTYRTLMTRGMKGCYIYCTDDQLSQYIKSSLLS
jgi:DUF2075 family protein